MTFMLLSLLAVAARGSATAVYLPANSVDVEELIGPPPAPGSPELEEQLAIVLWLQKTRTPEQIAFVGQTLNLERFAPLLGDALLGVDGVELKHTLDAIIDEVRTDYDAHKDKFDLPRPFQTYDEVQPVVVETRPVGAYPSGHAIRAIVYARLLSEIFPEHREALMSLAHRIGYGRVIAGVHYPIDVTTGQEVGQAYADVVVGQASFKEAAQRIRGEHPPSRHG